MGRHTYEKVLTFGDWPYPKPVVVMSRHLKTSDIPSHLRHQVSVSAESPADIMERLEWKRACLCRRR